MGQASTHVTECQQANIVKIGKDVVGDKEEWVTYEWYGPDDADIHIYMRVESLDVEIGDKWTRLHG